MDLGAFLIGLFFLVYGALAVAAWRRPLLARLAFREAVRRPWQFVLVVAGLTIGTSIILMSLVNGDSMSVSLTEATYRSWGRVDLLVTAGGQSYSREIASGLADSPRLHGKLGGVQAGVELVGSVADLDRRLDDPMVRLIGFDASAQHPFGAFITADGRQTFGQDLGADELLLSKSLADSLQARPGDHLQLTVSRAAPADFKVAAITTAEGPGAYGGQPAVFGTLAAMKALTGNDLINVVRLSALGDGPQELDNSKRISQVVARALMDLPGAGGLQVRTVKADDVDEVVKLADQNRPVTLALSSIIVLAGIAMVVNLALALAEERRPRLAILRALGLSRADLILATVLEGSIYSLTAAAIGALPGIVVGWLLVSQAGRWVPEIHEKNAVVVFVVSTEAVAISIAAGTLITLTTLVVASMRTTRLTIASAVRAMPDPPSQRRPHHLGSAAIVLLGLVGVVAVIFGSSPVRLLGGLGVVALWGLLLRGRLSSQLRATVLGLTAVAWVLGVYSTLSGEELNAHVWITVAALAFLIAALSAVVAANMRLVENLVPRSLVAQLTRHPPRLSLATAALGLVVAFLALLGVILATLDPNYRENSGGYDVRVTSMGTSSIVLPESLESQIAGKIAVRTLSYLGPMRSSSSDRSPGPLDWHQQQLALYEIPDGLFGRRPLPLAARDDRFADDDAVWAAVRDDLGLVLSGVYRPGTTVDLTGSKGPVQLHVAGTFKPGLLTGLMGSAPTMSSFSSAPAGETLLLKVRPGVNPAAFALDVRRSLFPTGVEALTTQELLDRGDYPIRNFVAEMQLLLTAGLAVGVLSLGLLALRAVFERRRSIGLLRAIGFQPHQLLLAVVGESLLMATGGMVAGIAGGLSLGYLFVTGYYSGGQVGFQAGNLSVAVGLVYLTAAAVTIAPALAVARTAPAQALRLVD